MKVFVAENAAEAAKIGADVIEEIVKAKPNCTLGFATGSSPIAMYQELAKRCEAGLDFSGIHTVNLDEYVGLPGTHDQGYRYFMDTNLFDHINIDKANTYVPKGTGDIDANLAEFNEVLDNSEVEVQVLGVGPDGHLGFNEPEALLYDRAHIATLEDSTIEANARFFATKADVPTTALTQGMGNIMRAKKILVLISNNKEKAATKLLLEDRIDPMCPVTFAKLHPDAIVILEKELAAKIGYKA
ncbi:MAG: glucosamine-6-phosphate deaminase [Lachnospiraceae bacterium]|nr:glucosamine-6-phosphate deaminase [Candidatus Minthocola equi]